MASILVRQNENFGSDTETLRQAGELEKPDSVAVLTGQQVGLFTGPVYTVYKALTALGIANELKKLGIPAVPIFWMDTEDHDLPEVTRRTVWENPSSIRALDYRTVLFRETGARLFDRAVQMNFRRIRLHIRGTHCAPVSDGFAYAIHGV